MWLNRRDDEIDNGSSSGTLDEGRRGVAVDDVVGEEAPAGWRTEQGVGFRRGFSRPRCTNGWADGMAVGNHGLETRLSEMWGKLRKYAVDDVVGEEAPAGWRTEQGVGFRRGFSRPRCTNGWADGMAVGNHGLETRLSEMWGKLRKYPHRFEAVPSVQGYHGHFACRDFTGGGSFRVHCNFGIARRGLRWRELSEHNETKIYLKYFGLTRQKYILNISG